MIPSETIDSFEKEVERRKTSKVIGLILAPYNRSYVRNIVNQYYNEWNSLSDDKFDLYWIAYGDQGVKNKQNQIILDLCGGNKDNVYFDIDQFAKELAYFQKKVTYRVKSNFELILFNSLNGKINYKDRYRIDFEQEIIDDDCLIKDIVFEVIQNVKKENTINVIKKDTKRILRKKRLMKVSIFDLITIFEVLPL